MAGKITFFNGKKRVCDKKYKRIEDLRLLINAFHQDDYKGLKSVIISPVINKGMDKGVITNKIVRDTKTGEIYLSIAEAARNYHLSSRHLSNMLRGISRNKTNLTFTEFQFEDKKQNK